MKELSNTKKAQYLADWRKKNSGKSMQYLERYWAKRLINCPSGYLKKLLSEVTPTN